MTELNPLTQADSVHSTPPTNTSSPFNEIKFATAFRRLEPNVQDLVRMATIAERLVAELLEDLTNDRAAELSNFAVQHLSDMLREFKENYYKQYEEEGRP